MTQAIATPTPPSCSVLFSTPGIAEFQLVGPDLSILCWRDPRGRFAKGRSSNPKGRPRGICNPRRRVRDLVARPLGAQALARPLHRKPHLLRPLAAQLLPPPRAATEPAARLAIDFASLRTADDVRRVLATALAAAAAGEITPPTAHALRGASVHSCARRRAGSISGPGNRTGRRGPWGAETDPTAVELP